MLPFPKRSPAPNEYDLSTGDYESYRPRAVVTPTPARQPLWGRSVQRSDYAPYSNVQVAPHVHADMRMMHAPPPPHSLAPMAMPRSAQTGSYPGQPTVVIRGRGDYRWGITLAVAGALLGGILGVAMNNSKSHAAAAMQSAEPQTMQMAAQPAVAPVSTAVVAPQVAAAPTIIAPQAVVAPQAVAVAAPAPVAAAPQVATSNTFAAPVQAQPVAPPTAVAKAPHFVAPSRHSHAGHAQSAGKHHAAPRGGSMVAAKVSAPTAPPPGAGDAMAILKAASKDSSNTLGGSL